jgi:hypothetical protein
MNTERQLSIEKCTKYKCERCDMGYILRQYVKPIMQCLTNDIKAYNMELKTTKCLNSSLTLAYFMLGKKGIAIADYCDTVLVKKRHQELKTDNNTLILDNLEKQITYPICKYRQLFYILITDTYFPHPDGKDRHFPGHVFILEKIPGPNKPYFYFHQSYINKYDYSGHIKRNNNSLKLSLDRVKDMIKQIRYVILNPIWDENTVKYWKEITYVDTKDLLGAKSGGKMFLCFKKARLTECIGRLDSYVTKKLKDISKLKLFQLNDIYGDASAYDSEQVPLTVIEMKKSLEKLQKTIKKYNIQISSTK